MFTAIYPWEDLTSCVVESPRVENFNFPAPGMAHLPPESFLPVPPPGSAHVEPCPLPTLPPKPSSPLATARCLVLSCVRPPCVAVSHQSLCMCLCVPYFYLLASGSSLPRHTHTPHCVMDAELMLSHPCPSLHSKRTNLGSKIKFMGQRKWGGSTNRCAQICLF